ncbi:MAG TPA: hypothetical protein PLR50_12020, partial [Candidatus Rifleibacterium sp.]|nr:hypothetical protein [Candidatus Rifleibacterium sp.]
MTVHTNSMLFLAGLENALFTDPNLTVADVIPTGRFLPGYKFEELRRLVANKGIDAAKKLIGREMLDFDFEVELLASGVVGVAPTWGRLIEACGFTKEVLAAAAISDPIAGYGNNHGAGDMLTVWVERAETHDTCENPDICRVFQIDGDMSKTKFANARLIAASPKLFASLVRLETAARHRDNTMGDPCRLIEV